MALAIAGLFVFSQLVFLIQPAQAATATASDESELVAALADTNNDTINITASFSTSSQITISREVTINGNGHTIDAVFTKTSNSNNSAIGIQHDDVTIKDLNITSSGDQPWPEQLHGINVYTSIAVNLEDVTATDFEGYGVLVNGSSVTVSNITTMNNGWGGINVDLGGNVDDPAVLTINGISIHTDVAHVYADHYSSKPVTINDTNNQYLIIDNPPDPNNYTDDRLYQLDPERFAYSPGNSPNLKIDICHATESESNPFTETPVALDGLNGHGDHEDDIIPPNPDLPNGLNWTRDGIEIWQNGCDQDDEGQVGGETCEVGSTIFQIGDVEGDPTDHPADEFTGSGNPGDFGTSHADPFVVGVNSDEEFPWNSNFSEGYGLDFEVEFSYAGPDIPSAELTVAWSPGKSAVENKEVWLNYTKIADFSHNGTSVAGWYNNSEVFEDTVSFPLEAGDHTLRFVHTSGDGTFWDYVSLTQAECPDTTPQECSISLFSNTLTQVEEYEGAGAEELTFVHSGWTADIPGATWIWSDDPVVDTDNDTIRTFVQDFYWSGPVTTAVLDVAADNSYEVYVNGVLIGGDASEKNFTLATQDQYDISGEINDGVNTLEIVVTNKGVPGSSPTGNPAGVLFAATVTGTDQYCDAPLSECVVDFSDTTLTVNEYADANAHEVSFIHSAWTATIDGATWVWGDDPVADPVNDTTQTFKREFSWNGPVASAVLDLAADNSYRVLLNGVEVAADSSENNFASTDTIDLSAHIQDGVNTLEVEVKNWAQAGGTTESNPAGLLYRLVVEGENGCIPDEEQAEPIGRISGVAYNDENDDGSQNGDEPGLNGWEIWLLTQNSPFTLIETFTTDDSGSGEYLFEDLAYGTYFVCQFPQSGWTQTEVSVEEGVTVEIDDRVFDDSCYKVELNSEKPVSAENDFGNSLNVEGAVTTKDPDNGSVLGDNTDGQVLAETGDAAWQLPAVGALMAITSIAAGLASRQRFSTQRF